MPTIKMIRPPAIWAWTWFAKSGFVYGTRSQARRRAKRAVQGYDEDTRLLTRMGGLTIRGIKLQRVTP